MASLNEYREKFRQYAKNAESKGPGFYSLVLPTGGGKTLTGLTLASSLHSGSLNVIYVCPRNSILEQTRRVYEEILGEEYVLAHYGYPEFIADKEERNFAKMDTLLWNKPFILTSYVQFFESLFHNKVPKLLKFCELYERVIIIDETQLMSSETLNPTLKALAYLVDNLRCSIILMSATPPDFSKTIIKDRVIHTIGTEEDIAGFCALANNVDVHYVCRPGESVFDCVREEISKENPNSVLYVANTIEQAKNVFDFFSYHYSDYKVRCLTTNNVVQHRKQILKEVEDALKNKERIILSSTSIVEAGVDLDFDLGFREMTNLNSVVQCAGRVKRNRREERGNLFVLDCRDRDVIPTAVGTSDSERQMTHRFLIKGNPIDITNYNKNVACSLNYDKNKVLNDIRSAYVSYENVSKSMRVINNPSTPLFLRNYNEESSLLFSKAVAGESFNISRYMEYVVNVSSPDKFECRRWKVKGSDKKEIYTYEGEYDSRKGLIRIF